MGRSHRAGLGALVSFQLRWPGHRPVSAVPTRMDGAQNRERDKRPESGIELLVSAWGSDDAFSASRGLLLALWGRCQAARTKDPFPCRVLAISPCFD
jgi:hypothetical protein